MVRCQAAGASMLPSIRDGDLVTLSPVDPQRLKPGQVIAFETTAGMLAIHRLVATHSESGRLTFVTRRDARLGNDASFGVDRLIGQVVDLQRDGRHVPVKRPARLWLTRLRLRLRAKLEL